MESVVWFFFSLYLIELKQCRTKSFKSAKVFSCLMKIIISWTQQNPVVTVQLTSSLPLLWISDMMFMGLLNCVSTNPFLILNSPSKFLVGFWSLVFMKASESDKTCSWMGHVSQQSGTDFIEVRFMCYIVTLSLNLNYLYNISIFKQWTPFMKQSCRSMLHRWRLSLWEHSQKQYSFSEFIVIYILSICSKMHASTAIKIMHYHTGKYSNKCIHPTYFLS